MAEIGEQSQLESRGFQVIVNLRSVFISKLGNRFKLKNDFFVTNKVGFKLGSKRTVLVFKHKRFECGKRDPSESQFDFHAFLIDGFKKSAAFISIDLKACSDDLIRFLFKKEIRAHSGAIPKRQGDVNREKRGTRGKRNEQKRNKKIKSSLLLVPLPRIPRILRFIPYSATTC